MRNSPIFLYMTLWYSRWRDATKGVCHATLCDTSKGYENYYILGLYVYM